MTYVPGFSERLKNSNIYDKENYEIALKTVNTVSKLFSKTKTKIDKNDKHNVIYCNGHLELRINGTYQRYITPNIKHNVMTRGAEVTHLAMPLKANVGKRQVKCQK